MDVFETSHFIYFPIMCCDCTLSSTVYTDIIDGKVANANRNEHEEAEGDKHMSERLIEETRNGWLECEHLGSICGVDGSGRIVYAVGDMERPRFLRSAGKPLQAIPVVRSGALEHYGLHARDLAIMLASHRGEPVHMDTLAHIMQSTGIEQQELICQASYPLHDQSKEEWIRHGGYKEKRFHNCSGKHLGVLAWCQHAGYDKARYADAEHPAQQEIAACIAEMSMTRPEELGTGVDGCGFPVLALPLPAIARAYLHIACPEKLADASMRTAVERVREAMIQYPLLVGGTGRLDSVLMEDDNITAKGGFKGIFGFSLREEQLGFAVKIDDGNDEECAYVVTEILQQIGYRRNETIKRLKETFPIDIHNDQGVAVGSRRPVFRLERG